MNKRQHFLRKIKAPQADKLQNLQAPLFEELSDSETSQVVGGSSLVVEFQLFTPQDIQGSEALVSLSQSAEIPNFSN
ncbi:MAG: hypothetical protein V7L29_23180 [Nostoc sp.]|uniref:hypothetical protein n=1 Tax=Nostoc sp. TaxID=1180 RepID=UPI002FF60A9B